MDTVKLCADLLPARADQHFAVKIHDRYGNAGELPQVIHERLNQFDIEDIMQFEAGDVAFRRQDAVQLSAHLRSLS